MWYTFSQSYDQAAISFLVPLESDLKVRPKVRITAETIDASIEGVTFISGKLFGRVLAHDSLWQIEGKSNDPNKPRTVTIHLEKEHGTSWPVIIVDDASESGLQMDPTSCM
jgi:hypothetical protein